MKLRYFKYKEFDSPDLPRSGLVCMKKPFLNFIDELRHRCGFPFKVTSGFRTYDYNQSLIKNPKYKASATSSHLRGIAADIAIIDSKKRALFIGHAIEICHDWDLPLRIGVGDNFCHIDLDREKNSPRIWVY